MTGVRQLRFDFQTLFDLCHRRSGLPLYQQNGGAGAKPRYKTPGSGRGLNDWRPRDKEADRGFSISYMAEMLSTPEWKIHHSTLVKWQKQGYIPFDSAEKVACALGLTTMNIWPGEYNSWVPERKRRKKAAA